MESNEVKAMPNAELRIKIALLTGATKINQDPDDENLLEAYWPERDEGRGEGWQEILDYPEDIAAAWGLWQIAKNSDYFWDFCRYLRRLADSEDFTVVMNLLSPDLITRAYILAKEE